MQFEAIYDPSEKWNATWNYKMHIFRKLKKNTDF